MSILFPFFNPGPLFYFAILLLNAVAVLSEDRFLARIGWGRMQQDAAFGASYDNTSIKARGVDFVHTVIRGFRIPLMFVNTVIIVYEILLG